MRIVVIGGTGFIGSRVVERLALQHEVIVVHRGKHAPPAASSGASARYITGDRDRLAEHAAEFQRLLASLERLVGERLPMASTEEKK